ncbi:hypothetical protein RHJ63_07785 [Thermosynechococcus sp. JY1334]|uniref:hypothetical protein n=1 Tax=unclassified Thermosynechococcus TaxID=2622553 RepID=UPI002671243C|nr:MULTISPECIES: hypothetical protein [unclassified Thermosynechococcus]MDR5639113.1 hypothetical protein [Thermosynechococcus sp. PP42]MDR7898206.1 hypothetical protein [Thermosynechococcus sp. JY1332]MDR7905607.1 hypothetical protein [Thermosynechococcus sp. JY1334]WKT85337.1 hypothetical protein QYC30_07760 [Thermosynechococcus sp. JY1339]WNC54281.1 hypothetical protein RHJ31_07750 [Thermosynechococcus sp. JY1331]
MSHGLLWLPLLAVFILLAWLGWVEYRKVEHYRQWAKNFETSKYDIAAVLGQQGDRLTWGHPTQQGIIHLQTCELSTIQNIWIECNGQRIDTQTTHSKGAIQLVLETFTGDCYRIPFTEFTLALAWRDRLQRAIRN